MQARAIRSEKSTLPGAAATPIPATVPFMKSLLLMFLFFFVSSFIAQSFQYPSKGPDRVIARYHRAQSSDNAYDSKAS